MRGGYRSTRDDKGVLTVHDVPIFVECERNDVVYDETWLTAAFAKAKQAEAEGYLPPLHVRHHEPATDAANAVRAAGFFRITGLQRITFKGAAKLAVIADLIVVDPQVQAEIESMRLPYRSVEIFNVEKPAFDSLALLDHEAPFLELPMLMLAESGDASGPRSISRTPGQPVLAAFRRGDRASILFSGAYMDPEKKGEEPKGDSKPEKMAMDTGSIVKAIKSGEITVADMDAIVAAIAEYRGSTAEEPEGVEAPAPGSAAMKKDSSDEDSVKFAAMQARIDGLEAKVRESEAAASRQTAVADAMKKLAGRPLGADLEAKLFARHAEFGAKAFTTYVEDLAKIVAPSTGNGETAAEMFAKQTGGVALSDAVMAYQKDGPAAVEKAAKFSADWKAQSKSYRASKSEADYIKANFAREAILASRLEMN